MENTSSDKLADALKLLEEAARQKKDELKTVMADKYTHLKGLILENEAALLKTVGTAKDGVVQAAMHAKDASVEKARELAHDTDKRVHESPWSFIAGSAVVGLLLGYVLGRARK